MAEAPIGISFMPSADAAANGPRQASIEGQGGSDLAAAFKILSLHLPRVLGAAAIAPKRLLNSQGAAAVGGPAGANPYAQVFQALLQSITGGMPAGGGDGQSLASLFGGAPGGGPDASGASSGGQSLADVFSGSNGGYGLSSGAPPPSIVPGNVDGLPRDAYGGPTDTPPASQPSYTGSQWSGGDRVDYGDQNTRYI